MNTKLKIIARAITIRIGNGEDFNDILSSYPALNEIEIMKLKEYFNITVSTD